MKIVYFARVRERIGKTDEEIVPPADVKTVGQLIGWLRTRGENYASAFDGGATVRAALDRQHVKHDALLAQAQEIALFPPMTGG